MNDDEIQRRVDAALTSALVPPRLSPSFRASLMRRIDEPSRSFASDAWPDVLHLAGGVLLTAFAASAAPVTLPVALATGTILTAGSYFALAMLRNSFDETAL